MNPAASPIETQFLIQNDLRRPPVKRSSRGSPIGAPSRLASSVAAASSSLTKRLQ
jgi:hypothetical protein